MSEDADAAIEAIDAATTVLRDELDRRDTKIEWLTKLLEAAGIDPERKEDTID